MSQAQGVPVQQYLPSAHKRLFFADGNHWQAHGPAVRHRPDGDPKQMLDSSIDVYSYFNKDRSCAPYVLLCAAKPPAGLLYHLTPTDARAFAASLVKAADAAEAARSALLAQQRRP